MHEDYNLFVAIVEAGSLSAAGRRLRISPAMVSKRLARLEARLGATLVHRTTRRLLLTEVGQGFHEDACHILDAIRAAEARVAGRIGQAGGRLRVSAPTSFGRMHVAPYLKAFLDRFPRIELSLDLDDGFVDLLGERIDIAIRIAAQPGGSLIGHRLAENRRVLCAAPAYLAAHGAPETLADLSKHRLLAADHQLPWRLEGPDGPVSLDGASAVRTNSSEVARELTIAGLGIALRSTWDVGPSLRDGSLVRILPEVSGATDVAIYAVQPRGAAGAPNPRAFVDHFHALFSPVPPWDR
ncbi:MULTISPECIES: LysR family transcriptional regulator [unclassified Sphingomonas]|uniref:LysR family transcriptional regulator n=1 Tax=unclassified Sphingomonas TaxID=196159 RepID=UPI0006FA6665|nr:MULTISPECIES: LysR family transcriptional regulator [unclassified Sphingomonas]KQX20076.1 LysR family transcriptional regulator [Sphingomonas sp. Root1294]KQY67327.1 LysR family transcriptional regulator [Sphingomonas sp. Root50]KRB90704.1 LysR family transcriptional regulator [Sphingomonas sp. Root720]